MSQGKPYGDIAGTQENLEQTPGSRGIISVEHPG